MVTGAIKNKVDKIWTDIWAGGITNPLTVIEQLTYLMFIRSLDEKELATEDFENMAGEKMEHIFPASAAGQSMRWSRFKDKDSREIFLTMQQRVFPAIKKDEVWPSAGLKWGGGGGRSAPPPPRGGATPFFFCLCCGVR